MKKTLLTFLLTIQCTVLLGVPMALAQERKPLNADSMLPTQVVSDLKTNQAAVPTKDFIKDVVPGLIKLFLGIAGTISFCVFVYAGVMMVVSQGNEEALKKFKDILIWSVIGLVCITMSYAIVRGITQLSFDR